MNPPLNINQIWDQFHRTGEDYYRNLLVEYYYDLVHYAAERLHARLPKKLELDDLISAGTFGLMDAIDAYDPKRGVKFETYCLPRIRGSILDELRSMDRVPSLVRARAKTLMKASQTLEAILGRKPLEEEIAKEMCLSMEELARFQNDVKDIGPTLFNTTYSERDGTKEDFEIDFVQDKKRVKTSFWRLKKTA